MDPSFQILASSSGLAVRSCVCCAEYAWPDLTAYRRVLKGFSARLLVCYALRLIFFKAHTFSDGHSSSLCSSSLKCIDNLYKKRIIMKLLPVLMENRAVCSFLVRIWGYGPLRRRNLVELKVCSRKFLSLRNFREIHDYCCDWVTLL